MGVGIYASHVSANAGCLESLSELVDLLFYSIVDFLARLLTFGDPMFLLFESNRGEVAVVVSAHLVHNLSEPPPLIQKLHLDLVFKLARVLRIKLFLRFLIVFLRRVRTEEL